MLFCFFNYLTISSIANFGRWTPSLINHLNYFHSLIGQFERIAEQAVRTPLNTAELMEIIAYLGKSKTQTIPDLEKRLFQAKDELIFLLDNTELPPADLRLNARMFSWIERMPAAFEEHATIAKEKAEQFKEALTVSDNEIVFILLTSKYICS